MDFHSARRGRVALPICRIRLTAQKPPKLPTILITIGDHIRKRRIELGLLQHELASRLEVRVDTILNWEHSRTTPTLGNLPGVISFLGYDPSNGDLQTLGAKVLYYRKRRGLSQKELAKLIGIDPTTLSRIERNRGRCSTSILQGVAEYLIQRH